MSAEFNHKQNQQAVESGPQSVPACHAHQDRPDWLLRICLTLTILCYFLHLLTPSMLQQVGWFMLLSHSVFELINTIWWGILLGFLMIAILGKIPREFVVSALGTAAGARGILRASLAGVLLDLCSHGILMVGAKLYERGASTGQVMAFLVSSPWNSLSLTFILIALIGLPWTLAFIMLSFCVAFITGMLFDALIQRSVLLPNKNRIDLPSDFQFWPEAKRRFNSTKLDGAFWIDAVKSAAPESRMVVRWILFGVLLASLIRALVSPDHFQTFFGPTLMGLMVTIGVATILEVCSEGSTPIAADILNRAGAPGNSFAFLMGGVATDYTEIMVLREATNSIKTALFLPLITVPQVLFLGWIINTSVS